MHNYYALERVRDRGGSGGSGVRRLETGRKICQSLP